MEQGHDHEDELLFLHCSICGSGAITVMIMEGMLLFDCGECKNEIGAVDNIQEFTEECLSHGCSDENHHS